ncbi:MAG: N-acetylmuramoyl-L-alanine amidase [Acidobacteriia bacterium]|nr:N-acetylmuramoyl-L-alanine amidase [Terriglobia bacterium]
MPEVWLVERKHGEEVYSNGLRIETGATVRHMRRSYASISLQTGKLRTDGVYPAGIVYHTTESHIAVFEAANNLRLQRVGQWVLQYLTRNRSYHYFVDRFGRVHRAVGEEDSADHAGSSIWADRERVYLGLNHSFLGVALEGQTEPGDGPALFLTGAQIHSTRVLTEMLRSRYKITSGNCITHAQVSVNRSNFRIGNHTDWASNFPFQRIGLPDNYNLPIPGMILYGFGYDQDFVLATGERLRIGLSVSENQVRLAASASGISVASYRAKLREEFRRRLAELPASEDPSVTAATARKTEFVPDFARSFENGPEGREKN